MLSPPQLHPPVIEHTRMGIQLLAETAGVSRTVLASPLAESLLLAGRIGFFDLRQPDDAEATLVRALQAAGEADDPRLGSAILAHAAFIPAGSAPSSAESVSADHARLHSSRLTGSRVLYDSGSCLPGT